MDIGDVVVPTAGSKLISGSGQYSHAVCASVDPLILISEDGGMRWNNIDPLNVIALRKADDEIIKIAVDKLDRDNSRKHEPDQFFAVFERYIPQHRSGLLD